MVKWEKGQELNTNRWPVGSWIYRTASAFSFLIVIKCKCTLWLNNPTNKPHKLESVFTPHLGLLMITGHPMSSIRNQFKPAIKIWHKNPQRLQISTFILCSLTAKSSLQFFMTCKLNYQILSPDQRPKEKQDLGNDNFTKMEEHMDFKWRNVN